MGGVEVFVGEFEVMRMGERRLVRGVRGGWRMMRYCFDGRHESL